MTEEKRWYSLKEWLRRDLWTKTQACYIYALLIRNENDPLFESEDQIKIEAILKEHRNDYERESREVRAKEYLELWDASIHEPPNKVSYASGIYKKFFTKEYCISWALKKSISLPWLNWAIESKLVNLEEQGAKNIASSASTGTLDTIGVRKETNLYRLISIMAELMVDPNCKSQFSSVAQMTALITEKYKDKEPEQSGLSKKALDIVFRDVRKIRPIGRTE